MPRPSHHDPVSDKTANPASDRRPCTARPGRRQLEVPPVAAAGRPGPGSPVRLGRRVSIAVSVPLARNSGLPVPPDRMTHWQTKPTRSPGPPASEARARTRRASGFKRTLKETRTAGVSVTRTGLPTSHESGSRSPFYIRDKVPVTSPAPAHGAATEYAVSSYFRFGNSLNRPRILWLTGSALRVRLSLQG